MTNQPLNILQIGNFPEKPSLMKGGVEASVYGLAKTLATTHNVTIIALPRKASEFANPHWQLVEGMKVRYLQAPKWLMGGIIHLPFILRILYQLDKPVVHIHGTGLVQFLLLLWMRMFRINAVWTLHGITEKETLHKYRLSGKFVDLVRHYFYTILEKSSLCIGKKIIVDTEYVKQEAGNAAKIKVIPQGIFLETFSETQYVRDKHLVVSIGVFTARKGHDRTLKSFAEVVEQCPDARLVIAGAMLDASYYHHLQELIEMHHLQESVTLLPDAGREQIIALLQTASLFVLHSQEESQGIAICEAMACGLPIIATRVGGITYIVRDKIDGILTVFGNMPHFAQAITYLLKNRDIRLSMAQEAKAASLQFNWQTIAREIVNLYRH